MIYCWKLMGLCNIYHWSFSLSFFFVLSYYRLKIIIMMMEETNKKPNKQIKKYNKEVIFYGIWWWLKWNGRYKKCDLLDNCDSQGWLGGDFFFVSVFPVLFSMQLEEGYNCYKKKTITLILIRKIYKLWFHYFAKKDIN